MPQDNVQRSDQEDAATSIPPESSIPVVQEYKGSAMILLNPGAKWPFSFGLGKARVVLANMRYIQTFVDTNGSAVE